MALNPLNGSNLEQLALKGLKTMTLNYLLLNFNSINETLLSVLYFSTYDCVYTDLVLSGCVVIFKIFYRGLLYDFSVLCILFIYCGKHARLTCV